MQSSIPALWRTTPPSVLLLGQGSYASALAFVVGAATLDWEAASAGPQPNADGRLPRVLDPLERVFAVPDSNRSDADILGGLEGVWAWIEKLSGGGPEHEVALLLIAPPRRGEALKRAMAIWLGVGEADLAAHGHAVCEMGMPLAELLISLRAVVPCDRVRLLNRRAADLRRRALTDLSVVIQGAAGGSAIPAAATAVVRAFDEGQHEVDLFCRPPSHANGNRLRALLKRLVTEAVTPELVQEARALLPDALA